jgi:integrase
MARPRVYLRVDLIDGRYVASKSGTITIDGYSINEATREVYTIVDGVRKYNGRDVDRIARQYLTRLHPDAADVAKRQLENFGLDPAEVSDETVTAWIRADADGKRALAASFGADTGEVDLQNSNTWEDYDREIPKPPQPLPSLFQKAHERIETEARGPTLKSVLETWQKLKAGDDFDAVYLSAVARTFKRFMKVVGNKPLALLTADDFADWRRWTNRSKNGPAWYNEQHTRLATVFRAVRRDKPSWPWLPGLADWLSGWDSKKHQAERHHRKPMPVDVFDKLLAACDAVADSPDNYGTDSQSDLAKRRHAKLHKIEAARMSCMIKLAANAALGNIDLCRICWQNCKLDAPVPHMDFPRQKTLKTVGVAIDRLTPLLPNVVMALKELWGLDPTNGYVFKTAQRGPYTRYGLDKAIMRLFRRAKVKDWTFKHIRNIAPSLGRRHKRARDERDAILGHAVGGTSKFYEDDVDETYLVDLVNLVGQAYFGGDKITIPAKLSTTGEAGSID